MTIKTLEHETAINKCEELAALVARHTDGKGSGAHATAIDPLVFMRQSDTSTAMAGVSEVIKRSKADFTKPLRVEELAEQANMSAASFHRHFKAVTSMSPLQYQKQLRLLSRASDDACRDYRCDSGCLLGWI